MGVYDRDYFGAQGPRHGVRRRVPGGGMFGGGRGAGTHWIKTVNAWLILLCVAVFVLDGGQRSEYVETGRYWEQHGNVWHEVIDTPFTGRSIRSDATHLDPTVVQDEVTVKASDGTTEQRYIQGRKVEGHTSGQEVVAEVARTSPLGKAFHFSTKRVIGGAELWRLLTFQFVHADMSHLLFNMIALYFFGSLIENVLGSKRYLAFYLICGVAGGLLYLLLNMAGYVWVEQLGFREIPGLLFNATGTPLIGASAGVFGVLIGGAFLAPQARVLLFMVIPMRLATLAKVLIVISVVKVFFGMANAGGEAAHLGGAMAGWGLIRHPHRLHRFFDWLGRFDPTSRHFRSRPARSTPGPDEVDRILAKISREGLQSLTDAEKRILQEASERGES
ncbi:MAG: rhomboid family intramembrane serine protease [Phycisphaerales bacterium]|nr:rhomboid family intramembrane serine protease [Phycisphaerales bacterium]